MEMLKPLLAAILDEASFDLECKETGYGGGSRRPSVERISAAELRKLATRQGQQVLDRSVRVRASDQAMSGLVDALHQVLGRFSEPNIRFEDDQVVWRALQAYRNAAPAGEALPAKGAGFPDALIVLKALRLASDDGESLNAVYTFDAAMQSLPHTAPLS